MKKRVNISIGEKLHADAVALAKEHEMDFSEMVSGLLRDVVRTQFGRIERQEADESESDRGEADVSPVRLPVDSVKAVPVMPLPGTRLLSERPAKNRPCPCGSGEKYKKCCEPHYPLVLTQPRPIMSRNVSERPSVSIYGPSTDEQDD